MSHVPFNVWITPDCYEKICAYAKHASPNEIGGLGRISQDGKDVTLTDFMCFDQTVSRATFDLDDKAVSEWMRTMMADGRTEELGEWRSIVHTHPPNATAKMSQTDVHAIERYAAEGDAFSFIIEMPSSYYQSNKKPDMLMHYCVNINGAHVIVSNIPVHITIHNEYVEIGDKLAKSAIREFAKLATLTDNDKQQITQAVSTAIHSVPSLFESEIEEYDNLAKEHCAQIAPKYSNVARGGFGYGSAGHYPGWAPPNNTPPPKTKQLPPQASFNAYRGVSLDVMTEKEKELVFMAMGMDPRDPSKAVSNNKQKKAKRILDGKLNKYRAVGNVPMFEVGDIVFVKPSAIVSMVNTFNIDGPELDNLLSMEGEEHIVEEVASDAGRTEYLVGGWYFQESELVFASTGKELVVT